MQLRIELFCIHFGGSFLKIVVIFVILLNFFINLLHGCRPAVNSYYHNSQISPGRKSLHEPLFVSDGRTIRCDPYPPRKSSSRQSSGARRRQTLPSRAPKATENKAYEPDSIEKVDDDDVSEHVAACRKERSKSLHVVQRQERVPSQTSSEGRHDSAREDVNKITAKTTDEKLLSNTQDRSTSVQITEMKDFDSQTSLIETQNIDTQTSFDIPPRQQQQQQQQQPPTTVAVIENQQQQTTNNGAIPKHSRKKSLPEEAYLTRTDSGG